MSFEADGQARIDLQLARLGAPASVPPNAPGPFAFQDTNYVLDILTRAGFEDPAVETVLTPLIYPGDLGQAASLASKVGAAVRIMNELGGTEEDGAAIAAQTEKAFKPFVKEDGVHVPALIHVYRAINAG